MAQFWFSKSFFYVKNQPNLSDQGGDRDSKILKILGNTEVGDPAIPKIWILKFSKILNTKNIEYQIFNTIEYQKNLIHNNTENFRIITEITELLLSRKKKIFNFLRFFKISCQCFRYFLAFFSIFWYLLVLKNILHIFWVLFITELS